ncbi:DUF6397 family protein [Streptomyces sp. NPDC091272]|uniref:DUF6397 family protein n=1 Tax=Streptomyces sp. NPDC091272 TaxID=3365981 RepID=UPI003804CB4B
MVVREVQEAQPVRGRRRASPVAAGARDAVTAVRAARELGLRRGEFDLAVQLGRIRTVASGEGGRRVSHEEMDRLREQEATATPLRERMRTAGTTEGAALLHISRARFTGLARAGYLSPARFYLNRYRAVVWLYLVEELTDFKVRHPELLTGNYPLAVRTAVATGEDRRARNWRSRRIGQLLGRTEDPWEQAAVFSSFLAPRDLDQVLDDPQEAAHLAGLRSAPVAAVPRNPAARDVVHRLLVAEEDDEITWVRLSLSLSLTEARANRPLAGQGATVRGGPPHDSGDATPAPSIRTHRSAVPARSLVPTARGSRGSLLGPGVRALRGRLHRWTSGAKRRRQTDEAH